MESETASENDATIERLEIRSGDRVLEIGFGPGRTLERVASAVGSNGKVFGAVSAVARDASLAIVTACTPA